MQNQRYSSVKRVLWIILFANFAVAAIKIGIGIACKSQSVTADGIHSLADGSSNIVGLVGIWLASKPKDFRHPYGHDKYEIIAGLFIGVMLAVMSARILGRAAASLQNPVAISISFTELFMMLFTIAVNIVVAKTEYQCGKNLKSTILITDSLHTRGDIMISAAVLLGLVGIKIGIPTWVDGVLSMVVAAVVLVSSWKIIKDCIDILVDSTAVDENEVKELLMPVTQVRDVHQVRSRGNLSHAFIDLHVVVEPGGSIEHMHTLSHKLEAMLKEHFGPDTDVYIHMEPSDKLQNKQKSAQL